MENHFGDPAIVKNIIIRKETDKELSETEIRSGSPGLARPMFLLRACYCISIVSTSVGFLAPGLKQYLVLVEDECVDEDMDVIQGDTRSSDYSSYTYGIPYPWGMNSTYFGAFGDLG